MAHRKKRKLRTDRLALVIIGCIAVIVCLVLGGKALLSGSDNNNDDQTAQQPSVVDEPQEEKETVISLVGVGDNLIHETVYLDAQNEDGTFNFEKMYSNVRDDIQAADIAFINQETVL